MEAGYLTKVSITFLEFQVPVLGEMEVAEVLAAPDRTAVMLVNASYRPNDGNPDMLGLLAIRMVRVILD